MLPAVLSRKIPINKPNIALFIGVESKEKATIKGKIVKGVALPMVRLIAPDEYIIQTKKNNTKSSAIFKSGYLFLVIIFTVGV